MTARTLETRLANSTLLVVIVYAPLETWASWPRLSSPYYLIDAIGMMLLLAGALHSRRVRPHNAPGLLAAGWAWTGANLWRATFDRVEWIRTGGQLQSGAIEMWVVAGGTVLALGCLVMAVLLAVRADSVSVSK